MGSPQPALFHLFSPVSLTGRGLSPQFPADYPSYFRRSYTFSLSSLLGSCSPAARQPLGQCLGPCHSLSDSESVGLRSLHSSFSLAVFGYLFYICRTTPQICASGAKSVVIDKTDHRSITEQQKTTSFCGQLLQTWRKATCFCHSNNLSNVEWIKWVPHLLCPVHLCPVTLSSSP